MSPRLSAEDVRIFHRTTYVPSMRYGLAAVALDEEELSTVQSRIIPAILKKLNVQSTISTAIRHGPRELGGLDLYDLMTEAGIESLKFFRDAIYSSDSENGKLLRLNLQYSQLEAGIGKDLLQFPDIHLSYLTPTWILSLRQFLLLHNMSVTVSDLYRIPLHSASDEYTMQESHLARYSTAQQKDINLVRLYLQVNTLVYLTDSLNPKSIDLSLLENQANRTLMEQSSNATRDEYLKRGVGVLLLSYRSAESLFNRFKSQISPEVMKYMGITKTTNMASGWRMVVKGILQQTAPIPYNDIIQ